jgi:ABC-type multidrug transport system fused ATPase/permease subunit
VVVRSVRAGRGWRQDGAILEAGTHQELMGRPGGAYVALVRHQQSK